MPEDLRKTAKELFEQAYEKMVKEDKENKEAAKALYLQAAQLWEGCSSRDLTEGDWKCLARCYHHMNVITKASKESLEYGQKAIDCLRNNIPIASFDTDYWDSLALYEYNMANDYKKLDDSAKAQERYLVSLGCSLKIKISELTATEYEDFQKQLRTIFGLLAQFFSPFTTERLLFSFAKRIFAGRELLNFKDELREFHHTILTSSTRESLFLLRAFINLMQLVEANIAAPGFRNEKLKIWFADDKHPVLFKKLLKDAQDTYQALCQPLSLLESVEHSSNFSVAVANQLARLQASVKELQSELQSEKKENLQLKKMVDKFRYGKKHTLFEQNSEHRDKKRKTVPPIPGNHSYNLRSRGNNS